MGEVTKYPNGTHCWVDLGTTDIEGAKRFYGDLFGWELEDIPTGPESFYTMCRVNGRDVAGIYDQPAEERAVAPPHWNTYISVDDLDAAATKAKAMGPVSITDPFDVMERGRMVVLQDPTGALVSLWEPKRNVGAGLVNEVGTWTWCDLATRDPDKAMAFYGDLFGWQFEPRAEGYWSITRDPFLIGGMRTMDQDPPETPPHWMPYFVLENAEKAVARVQELGGSILVPPRDVPAGRFLVFADPVGAFSGIIEMGPEGAARGVDGS
jgi:predicted enzyme related to lactoylglutathione lyase